MAKIKVFSPPQEYIHWYDEAAEWHQKSPFFKCKALRNPETEEIIADTHRAYKTHGELWTASQVFRAELGFIGWDDKYYSMGYLDELATDYIKQYGMPQYNINFSKQQSITAMFHE